MQKTLQADYEMKVQVIRSQGRAARLFVNIPMPLAAALDFRAGERIRWQRLGRSDLRLAAWRLPPRPGASENEQRFFSRIEIAR